MELKELDNGFAREVTGVKLWETPSAQTVDAIRTALKNHGVLVFRRQAIDENELAGFSALFGELDRIVRTDWAAQHPCVIQISNMRNGKGEPIGGLDAGELDWHTDQSYMNEPATGALLHMIEKPAEPVDTLWANLKLAFAHLPKSLRERVEGRTGVFQYAKRQAGYGEGQLAESIQKKTPDVRHPLVLTDPVTREQSLYLDPTTLIGVDGLDEPDAMQLVKELSEHATQEQFVYRHRWRVSDVVMWDNGFLMHRRGAFDPAGSRLLKRTTLRFPKDLHSIPD